MGGLRLPLNAFAREILSRLGLGVCQLNPNAWMLINSMQILWREVFEGDHPLTVNKFLYCYKPSEISQSLSFYQFSARGTICRLIKSLLMSDRNWKTKFFFVSGFWAENPVEVGRDPFPPYTGEIGNLCLEGMLPFDSISSIFYCIRLTPFFFFFFSFFTAIRRPSLSKFYLECIQQVHLFTNRSFHSLVTLQRLAT